MKGHSPYVLELKAVSRTYDLGGGRTLRALDDVSCRVEAGRSIAVVGRSGSGKSTLLHLAAGIDLPNTGSVHLHGRDISQLSDSERTRLRRTEVGLVFQFFHLLPGLSVQDNVSLPGWIAGRSQLQSRALELLETVGLSDRAGQSVEKLSGGEMQRVAICRALLAGPRLLLADEPTGNLDDENADLVMNLLLDLTRREGSTLIYVTHSDEMAALADEVWHLHSGRLDIASPATDPRPASGA